MADVFSSAPPEEDEDATPGLRVAGALTGDGEGTPEEEETPQVQQPQGTVDESGQAYLTPAGADDGETGPPSTSAEDVPVSADTKAYMTPIAPPTLAKPADYADHSADTAAMTAQKAAEAKENVKPSIGRKILAAFAGAATGFGSGSEAGARVGQSVLNAPRANAEARWATQEAPLQAKLNADAAADTATRSANSNTEQSNRLAETNYSNQIRGQQDAARAENYSAQAAARNEQVNGDGWRPDDPKNPLGGYSATSVGGKTLHSATAPAAVQNTADYRIADAAAKGHPFTTEQQQILRGGGKLTFRPPPNPRQPAVGELEMQAANAAFRRQYGRAPQTLDEQNQVVQTAKGMLGGPAGAAGPDEVIAKSIQDKDTFAGQWKRIGKDDATASSPEGDYQNVDDPGKTLSAKEFNNRIEKFRTDLNANPVMRKSGTMVDGQGNTVSNRFSRTPTTAAAAPPPQQAPSAAAPAPVYKAKSGGSVTLNTHVVVNGRAGIVTGFDAQGKPQVTYGGGGSGPPNPR